MICLIPTLNWLSPMSQTLVSNSLTRELLPTIVMWLVTSPSLAVAKQMTLSSSVMTSSNSNFYCSSLSISATNTTFNFLPAKPNSKHTFLQISLVTSSIWWTLSLSPSETQLSSLLMLLSMSESFAVLMEISLTFGIGCPLTIRLYSVESTLDHVCRLGQG